MLQIKTIIYRLDNAKQFDDAVNAAIQSGWQLTKREVVIPKAQSDNLYTNIMLYAELEKVDYRMTEPHFRDDRGVSG